MTETLFLALGKVAFFLVDPASLLVVLAFASLLLSWRGWRRTALAAQGMLAAALLAIAALPLGDWAIAPLERAYPADPPITGLHGIVILGGGEEQAVMARHGVPATNGAGERLMLGAALAREHPDAVLLWSGGVVALAERRASTRIAPLIDTLETLTGRPLVIEDRSRTTAENAARSAELLGPERARRWALVTSAFHMRRSVETFCAAGFTDLVPYPVDFRSSAAGTRWNLMDGLTRLHLALHERLGLLYYRVRGAADPGCAPTTTR